VETIASVPWIVNNSGDDYAKIGIGRSTGTKLICFRTCENPGVYEIELGLSVYEFMNSDEYLGGMTLTIESISTRRFINLPADLIYKTANGEDRLMTYESLSDGGTGSMVGGIVYDTSLHNTWNFARFIITKAVDNAPCRYRMVGKVLHRIENGHGREEDICYGYQSKIEGNTICPLGDAASWPVAAAIRHFREEFEYHVRFQKNKKQEPFVAEPFEK
jgi:NADH-quinone oxidoreductase subunit F